MVGHKNLQNYKQLGIDHFYKKDFNTAKTYFSLAYEKRKNKRLLNFISLCDLALNHPQEALLLFEFYIDNYRLKFIDKDFDQILNSVEFKNTASKSEFEDGYALNYKDFLISEEKIGFKKSFENIIHSGKLVINDRENFLEFLEKLLDNGYKDFTLNYIEDVFLHFWANKKFIKIQKKLLKMKNDSKI